MPWNKIPQVENCCGCVPDLRTAVTIIAALGIVTSPAVSWAVVRHAYMIRVSCIITANHGRPDVVDVNLNNVLSFGFGANAGIGQSCLGPHPVNSQHYLVIAVKYLGWVALIFDILFLFSSIYLLIKMQKEDVRKPIKLFMIAVTLSIIVSFIYAMLYVSACLQIGGSFPVFEFIFAFVDVAIWIYFLIVVRSYRRKNINYPSPMSPAAQYVQRVSTPPLTIPGARTSNLPNASATRTSNLPNAPATRTNNLPNAPATRTSNLPNAPATRTSNLPNDPATRTSKLPNASATRINNLPNDASTRTNNLPIGSVTRTSNLPNAPATGMTFHTHTME